MIACVLFMKRVMETTEISVITDEIDPNKESDITVHEENLMTPERIMVVFSFCDISQRAVRL